MTVFFKIISWVACFNIPLAKPHAKQIAYLSCGVLKQVQHDVVVVLFN
jgi:hypothetical protein